MQQSDEAVLLSQITVLTMRLLKFIMTTESQWLSGLMCWVKCRSPHSSVGLNVGCDDEFSLTLIEMAGLEY